MNSDYNLVFHNLPDQGLSAKIEKLTDSLGSDKFPSKLGYELISNLDNAQDYKSMIAKILESFKAPKNITRQKLEQLKHKHIIGFLTFLQGKFPSLLKSDVVRPLIEFSPISFDHYVDSLGFNNGLDFIENRLRVVGLDFQDGLKDMSGVVSGYYGNSSDEIYKYLLKYFTDNRLAIRSYREYRIDKLSRNALIHYSESTASLAIKTIERFTFAENHISKMSISELTQLIQRLKPLFEQLYLSKDLISILTFENPDNEFVFKDYRPISLLLDYISSHFSTKINDKICVDPRSISKYLQADTINEAAPFFEERSVYDSNILNQEIINDLDVVTFFERFSDLKKLDPKYKINFWSTVIEFLRNNQQLLDQTSPKEHEEMLALDLVNDREAINPQLTFLTDPLTPWSVIISGDDLNSEYPDWSDSNFKSKLIRLIKKLKIHKNTKDLISISTSVLKFVESPNFPNCFPRSLDEISKFDDQDVKNLLSNSVIGSDYKDPWIDKFTDTFDLDLHISKLKDEANAELEEIQRMEQAAEISKWLKLGVGLVVTAKIILTQVAIHRHNESNLAEINQAHQSRVPKFNNEQFRQISQFAALIKSKFPSTIHRVETNIVGDYLEIEINHHIPYLSHLYMIKACDNLKAIDIEPFYIKPMPYGLDDQMQTNQNKLFIPISKLERAALFMGKVPDISYMDFRSEDLLRGALQVLDLEPKIEDSTFEFRSSEDLFYEKVLFDLSSFFTDRQILANIRIEMVGFNEIKGPNNLLQNKVTYRVITDTKSKIKLLKLLKDHKIEFSEKIDEKISGDRLDDIYIYFTANSSQVYDMIVKESS